MSTSGLFSWAILVLTLIAAAFDTRTGRIPNALTLGTIVVAPGLHALAVPRPFAFEAAEWSLLAGALCGVAPLALWKLGWVGGGDVKLVAAIGVLGGPRLGLEAAFLAFFAVTAFGFLRLTWQGSLLRTMRDDVAFTAKRLLDPKGPIDADRTLGAPLRFGPFACVGALMSLILHGGGLL